MMVICLLFVLLGTSVAEEDCSGQLSSCYSNCDSTTVSCGAADTCFTFHRQCNQKCSSSYNDCIERQPKPPTPAPTLPPLAGHACPQVQIIRACEATNYGNKTGLSNGVTFIPIQGGSCADSRWEGNYLDIKTNAVYRSEDTLGTSGNTYLWMYVDKGTYPGYFCGHCSSCDCYRWYVYKGSSCGRSRGVVQDGFEEAWFYASQSQPWHNVADEIFCENGRGDNGYTKKETVLEIDCNWDAPFPTLDQNGKPSTSSSSAGAVPSVVWLLHFILVSSLAMAFSFH